MSGKHEAIQTAEHAIVERRHAGSVYVGRGRLKNGTRQSRRRSFAIAAFLVLAVILLCCWRWIWVSGRIYQARQYLAAGNPQAALVILKSAESLQPDRPELLFLLGRAHRRTGSIDTAVSYLERAFTAGWSAEQLRHQRYLTAIQSGRFDEAAPYLRDVLRTNTDDELAYEIYEAIAKGHLSAYRFRDALLCLNHFIAWREDAIEPRLWRADIYKRMLNWQGALDEYESILSARPTEPEALRGLALCLTELQRAAEAVQAYHQCLELQPDDVEAQVGLARAQWMLGDADAAERTYQALLELQLLPEFHVEVLMGLAQTANLRRQYYEATQFVEAVLQIRPYDAPANHLLGTLYAKLGREDEAEVQLNKAREYTRQISRFGEILQQLYDHPDDPDLRWEAGAILMAQGDNRNGAAWMGTALLIDPQHEKTLASLAAYQTGLEGAEPSESPPAGQESTGYMLPEQRHHPENSE